MIPIQDTARLYIFVKAARVKELFLRRIHYFEILSLRICCAPPNAGLQLRRGISIQAEGTSYLRACYRAVSCKALFDGPLTLRRIGNITWQPSGAAAIANEYSSRLCPRLSSPGTRPRSPYNNGQSLSSALRIGAKTCQFARDIWNLQRERETEGWRILFQL